MKKTKILSLLLSLSLFCSLIVPGTTAYAETGTAPGSGDNGMKISKTATANGDGTYTIKLEAFATGEKTTTTQTTDVPTDIVLVLDQSGSMDDDIGTVTFQQYRDSSYSGGTTYHTRNQDYYGCRHNGGSANLWHKLDDGSYVSVSVTKTTTYRALGSLVNYDGSWEPTQNCYWYYENNLYEKVGDEYKKVTLTRVASDGPWYDPTYTYTYKFSDGTFVNSVGNSDKPYFGTHGSLYTPNADGNATVYTYTYTDSTGAVQNIGTSTGANERFTPAFYQRSISTRGGGSRIAALRTAVTNFSNAVAAKAAGADGDINKTHDNIHHRIAVVGYASRYDSNKRWKNTEVFVGASQYNYNVNAKQFYGSAFQDMSTTAGKSNISASIGAIDADGATYTNYGLEMANGILDAYLVPAEQKRNRVIILFTDGYPGSNADNFNKDAANAALAQAKIAKDNGVSLYAVGIFSGADATTAGNYNGSNTEAANWFMQQVSSNNGTPRTSSYYLSAGDAESLNSIFQQISDNITTGGSSTTLGSETVVKDIISPYFTLPKGATENNIQIDTYKCIGKDGDTYKWSPDSDGNGGAKATVKGDQVSVTGFNFSENWCGTETDADGKTTYRGNKLVISFKVEPKADFLGGNNVFTNTDAGIYVDGTAKDAIMTFNKPRVNVPIKDVNVKAEDKNVYLKGEVTADQLKNGAKVSVGGVDLNLGQANYGLESWQTEYVNITVKVKGKDGNEIPADSLKNLTDDTTYTVEVTVAPKDKGESTPEKGDAATAKTGKNDSAAKINVFKPELTFKDSEAYYGADVPKYTDNPTKTEWTHGNTVSKDADVTMLGNEPELGITYTPEDGKIKDNKINTKQDVPVSATVKIGETDVNEHTTFLHQDCTPACGWEDPASPGDPAFLIHVKTCTLKIKKTGGANDESYVFDVYKDGNGNKYSEVTIWGNGTATLYELPVGTYTIKENEGWSWRYTVDNGGSAVLSAENHEGSITCTNTIKNHQWLNGFSTVVPNIFGTSHPSN